MMIEFKIKRVEVGLVEIPEDAYKLICEVAAEADDPKAAKFRLIEAFLNGKVALSSGEKPEIKFRESGSWELR